MGKYVAPAVAAGLAPGGPPGVGVIAALMALDKINAEGGIGILGTLLGIGAAAAASDPAAEPKPTKPAKPEAS